MFNEEINLNEKWYEININSSESKKILYYNEVSYKACSLENRINQYVKWYLKNTKIDKELKEIEKEKLISFIEKMANWYEIRYPDFELNNLIRLNSDDCISNNYNYDLFLETLSDLEKLYLKDPIYPKSVYLNEKSGRHFHLSEDGIVLYDEYSLDNLKFLGKNIKDVQKYLREQGVIGSELDRTISYYEKNLYRKEELLNCVMYKIIEKGKKQGCKRAFLFANEFKLDKSIPIRYAIDEEDLINLSDETKIFINEYLRGNGSLYTPCYPNYYSKSKNIGVISLIDIISNSILYLGDDKNLIKLRILNMLKTILLNYENELGMSASDVKKILTKDLKSVLKK